jgi:hypothetical protein
VRRKRLQLRPDQALLDLNFAVWLSDRDQGVLYIDEVLLLKPSHFGQNAVSPLTLMAMKAIRILRQIGAATALAVDPRASSGGNVWRSRHP